MDSSEAIAAAEARAERYRKALEELLRLYDWRFELAEREKVIPTEANFQYRRETSRMLRQYGEEKKAAWIAARAALRGEG